MGIHIETRGTSLSQLVPHCLISDRPTEVVPLFALTKNILL